MRTILILLLACSVALGGEVRRARTLEDVLDASCRVSVSGAAGTGSVVGVEGSDEFYVLTNYHVVQKSEFAVLRFLPCDMVDLRNPIAWRAFDANAPFDFALISISKSDLIKYDVPYIAMGGGDASPTANSYFVSSGAPKGRFVQAWRGKVVDSYGDTLLFRPGPVPGQSGSPIVSEIDGELWLTGILTWLIGTEGSDASQGGAIPVSKLYEAAKGRRASETSSPIPPGAVECDDSEKVEDFRKRPPVYERSDAGFFDDADSAWRNRGKKEEPKNEREETGILGRIERKLDSIGERIEQKIDERIETEKEKMVAKVRAIWFRALMVCCVAIIVCLMVGESIKLAIRAGWRKAREYFRQKAVEFVSKSDR